MNKTFLGHTEHLVGEYNMQETHSWSEQEIITPNDHLNTLEEIEPERDKDKNNFLPAAF